MKKFDEWLLEKQIHRELIKILHEGVRMFPASALNEGLVDKAEYELDLLMKNAEGTPIVKEFVPEIMALVKKFADSGQSGGSAPITAQVITQVIQKLLAHEPLGEGINGTDDEWSDNSQFEDLDEGVGTFQNKRLSSVFKQGHDGQPYYLNSIVWKPMGKDYTFTGRVSLSEGSKEEIGSMHYIKSFPFQPKTFVIDVHEKEYRKNEDGSMVEEEGGGWWESWLADPKQLDQVWEYYDKREDKKK